MSELEMTTNAANIPIKDEPQDLSVYVPEKVRKPGEIGFALLGILFGVLGFYFAMNMTSETYSSPSVFPKIASVIIIACGLSSLIKAVRREAPPAGQTVLRYLLPQDVAIMLAMLVAYCIALPRLHFIPSSYFFMVAGMVYIPGAPAAIATGMEGYPLAQRGEAGKAIGLCTTVSLFAGMVGVVVLAVAAPIIANFALMFSPRDFFLLAVMGILLIGSIGGGDPVKGVMAGTVGVLISMVGMDPSTGELRYTFGNLHLMAGISFVTAMIGLFGVSEALTQFRDSGKKSPKQDLTKVVPDWKTFKKYLPLGLRSSLLGVFIGALPGTGGDVAALLAYDQAKRSTRNPEVPFGHGALEGIVAPETANKGAIGGAFIPMLTLGIPGDAITAIMIGALFIHGLKPGPMLMIETPHLFWMIVSMLTISMVALFVLGLISVKPFSKIIEIPKSIIMPVVIILSVIGTYAIQNSVVDIFYMIGFGMLGYFMRLYGYPTGPMVLGLILGPMLDSNYRRAMQSAEDQIVPFLTGFFTSPISCFLVIVIFFLVFSQTKTYKKLRGLA